MNKKNTIRLTESELKRIITESVKNVLKEGKWDGDGDYTKTYEVKPGDPKQYYSSNGTAVKYHADDLRKIYKEYIEISGKLKSALKGTLRNVAEKAISKMESAEKMVKLTVNSSEVMAPVESPIVNDYKPGYYGWDRYEFEPDYTKKDKEHKAHLKQMADRQHAIDNHEKRMNKYYEDNMDTFVDMARESEWE